MKKILLSTLFLFLATTFVYSQSVNRIITSSKFNSTKAYTALTLEGGLSYIGCDFQKPGAGPAVGGMFEINFPSRSGLVVGLKLGGGYLQLKGRSDLAVVSDNNTQTLDFKTDVLYGSGMLTFALGSRKVIPYIGGGMDYIFKYTPKNNNGAYLLPDKNGKPYATFVVEGGLRYFMTKNTSANISAKYNFGKKDDLDGKVQPTKNDAYFTFKFGLSIYFFSNIRVK